MPMHRPSELRAFLEQLGIQPKKQLSQNFLIDGNIVRKIAHEAEACPEDVILEIGPGPGSLTEELLHRGARVLAVEKDTTLAHALERLSSPEHRLTVFCDDIMTFPIEATLKPLLREGRKAKIVANLPYHLTSPILARILPLYDFVSHVVVMVQDEVARRFVASPGSREYSHFTLFLSFYSTPTYAFTVSRQCFFPVPRVESAVVSFALQPSPPVSNSEGFFLMTRNAFEQRRKMLRSSLRDLYGSNAVTNALLACGLDPQARPEQLSLRQFLSLFAALE